MSKSKQETLLLAALKDQPVPESKPSSRVKAEPKPVERRGKPVNIYLHPEDHVKLRELAGYLAVQGERVSDSLVIKAALTVARGDQHLREAARTAGERDRRFKRVRE